MNLILQWIRSISIRASLGEIIEDYGVFSTQHFLTKQELRLLKCRKNMEEFFVIEARETAFLAKNFHWYKIDATAIEKLKELITP